MSASCPINWRHQFGALSCPRCRTQLPLRALYCSSCGERVKKIGDWGIRAEDGRDNAQEQDVDTIRLVSLSPTQLKRWRSRRSPQSIKGPEQSERNSPLSQVAEPPALISLETEPVDGQAPIPSELFQSLPATPAPLITETWQQAPDTEVPLSKPPGSNSLWPIIIILSALAATIVNFVFTGLAIRPMIVFWFLFVCPGMVLVRFLRLKEPVAEWTLAIALSFAVDAIVAGILLYAGRWSPSVILAILIGFTLGGAFVQLAVLRPDTFTSPWERFRRTTRQGTSPWRGSHEALPFQSPPEGIEQNLE